MLFTFLFVVSVVLSMSVAYVRYVVYEDFSVEVPETVNQEYIDTLRAWEEE